MDVKTLGIIVSTIIGIISIIIAWKNYKKNDKKSVIPHVSNIMEFLKINIENYNEGNRKDIIVLKRIVILNRVIDLTIEENGDAVQIIRYHIINATEDSIDQCRREWYADETFNTSFSAYDEQGQLPELEAYHDTRLHKNMLIKFRHQVPPGGEYKFTLRILVNKTFSNIKECEWFEETINELTANMKIKIRMPINTQIGFTRLYSRGSDGRLQPEINNIEKYVEEKRQVLEWEKEYPIIGRVYRIEFCAQ